MTIAQLVSQLERMDPELTVLLGNAPGLLDHLTETANGFVILDTCTDGTCCRAKVSAELRRLYVNGQRVP